MSKRRCRCYGRIRNEIGLTGTKYGCGIAQCGACTVLMDGKPVRSCSLPVSSAQGHEITTIEGLAQDGVLNKVQEAWVAEDVPQCGYCQSGQIMSATALLEPHAQSRTIPTSTRPWRAISAAAAPMCASAAPSIAPRERS